MIEYSTNWMGPICKDWCDKNGHNWAGGRIDVYNDDPYGAEIGIPPMLAEDWNDLTTLCGNLRTTAQLGRADIEQLFKLVYGRTITYWESNV